MLNNEMSVQVIPIPSKTIPLSIANLFRTERTITAIPIARATALKIISIISFRFSLEVGVLFLNCISSSTDTPSNAAKLGNELISEQDKSLSYLDTALSVTPIFWLIPAESYLVLF